MWFMFENGLKSAEALITTLQHDEQKKQYQLTVFGKQEGSMNYTESGKAYFEEEDFKELLAEAKLKSPNEIIGRRIKLVPLDDIEPEL